MTPVEQFIALFAGLKKGKRGWTAKCPAHDDRRASLSIAEGDDGKVLLKCHAGCTVEAIVSAVGRSVRDLMPEPARGPRLVFGKAKAKPAAFPTVDAAVQFLEANLGRHSALWTYTDAKGEPAGAVVRWDTADGKEIRPLARDGSGWRVGAMPDPRPLYRLPDVVKASRVLVTEGEKCADAARALGFVAATSVGGSQAAGKTDWRPLAGKEVWLLPDNDPPGRRFADDVIQLLAKLTPAPMVKILELPGLAEKGDLVDWVAAHGDAAEPDGMREEIEELARAAEYIGAGPPEPAAGRYRPFPLHALPEPIRGFVAAGARAIGCDPSYLALPLLVALGAAVGNTRRLELKRGWSAPAIVWGGIVGESGTAKTPAFSLVTRPVRRRQHLALKRHAEEMKEYELELARWDKEMAAWKRDKDAPDDPPEKPEPPRAARVVVSDTTVEALAPILLDNPRGLLLARDELASWFGSFDRYAGKGKGGSDSANWLSMFNAVGIIVDRRTGTPRTIFVPDAAVCVIGGIQPGILRRALGSEHRESGLAARLLLACPPRKPKSWTEADIDPAAEDGLVRLFDRLYDLQTDVDQNGEPVPVMVLLAAKAKAAWVAYYNAHALEQAGLTGDLSAAWSKLEEYAPRLALVVHFVRWAAGDPGVSNPVILDEVSMATGIELATWFKGEARRIYAMLDESENELNQRQLVEWIERKGGTATAREVQQGCRWLKEPGAADAALEALVKAGRGRWRDAPTTTRGGGRRECSICLRRPRSTKPRQLTLIRRVP